MSRPGLTLLFLVFFANLGSVRAAELPPGYTSDPGLTTGESDNGCKYSNVDGLVYFCGSIRDSESSEPVEGVTVAVYEELPPNPTLADPTSLYSATGKYGGNLVHLFTSTWTNKNGHFEITGRHGRNVYVAFLCGENLLGGMKRIQDLSRIEQVNEFVSCPAGLRYIDPPKQLNYVDREGFLECTANVYNSIGSGPTIDDPTNVGFASQPIYLARSEIAIENYDYRFMPAEMAKATLNATGISGFSDGRVNAALSDDFLGVQFENKAEWLGNTTNFGDGPWREADCRKTYKPIEVGGESYSVCSIDDVNRYLREQIFPNETGLGDDLYTVLNHLRFIPPEASLPAFARVDIRTSLRQFNQGNSAIARYMDAVFGNYVGEKPAVKEPGSAEGITEAEFDEDQLISCYGRGGLSESVDINNYSETGGPGSMLSAPGELMEAAKTLGIDQSEMQYPVCEDGASKPTAYEVCFGDGDRSLCRAEFFLPKGSGSAMMSYTSAEELDSIAQSENTLRSTGFNPSSTAADDAWKDQNEVILPSEINVHAARNPVSAAYVAGSPDFGGANYLGVLDPVSTTQTQVQEEAPADETSTQYIDTGVPCNPFSANQCTAYPGSFCAKVDNVSGRDINHCLYEQVGEDPFGQTPNEESKNVKPSPNAMKEEMVVQDVGSDSVAHCTISTIFDADDSIDGDRGGYEKLVRGYLSLTNPGLSLGAYLANYFTGNTQHAYQAVVGSGTFYTLDSLNRDRYLSYEGGGNADRDIFDGLRSMASGGTRIDFGTLTGANVQSAIDGIRGSGWWAALSSLWGGRAPDLPATKSFGDRELFQPTNMTGMTVYYPLNEENFDSYFPVPTDPFTPDVWGSHSNYDWELVPPGDFCATAADAPGGLSRTCRPVACGDTEAEIECDGSRCRVTNYRVRAIDDNCSAEERRTCAVDQESTDPLDSFLKANPSAESTRDEYDWPYRACVMQRAGPYTAEVGLNYQVANRITQENKYKTGVQTPVDATIPAVENLSKAFLSPTDQFVGSTVSAEVDIAHSESYDDAGVSTQGYPVEGIGGVPQNMYSVSAPPTVAGITGPDNPITYHCNNLGIPVEGTVKGGDWNCPVAPLPVCSGLFGQVQGIDSIPISPAGQTAISATFDLSAFQQSLEAYATIEEETGVPCEVMAGIHYREAGNDPTGSFEDGGALRNGSLIEDGLIVADDLLNDMGVSRQPGGLAINTLEGWSRALLSHNGWGNNNCSAPRTTPPLTEYNHCPVAFDGDDSNYIMAYADSNHDKMSIIYPTDCLQYPDLPYCQQNPGTIGIRADAFCSSVCKPTPPSQYATACGLCGPPISEQKVGALVLAKYLYDLGVGSIVK